MAKDPAVLLYTQDFLVGTLTMNYEQKGKYIYLLCLQHQKNKLTEKDLQLVLTDEDADVLEKFILDSDGFYYNIRMKEEAEKRANFTKSRRDNGTKGGRPKTTIKPNDIPNDIPKKNLMDIHMGNHIEDENENENVNENIDVNQNVITNTNTGVIHKILNNLIQLDDSKKHFQAVEDLEEIGGIDYISDILKWDDSVKSNWTRKIFSTNQIHSGTAD